MATPARRLVIANLIDNAVTYSDASPHLEVVLRAQGGMAWLGLRRPRRRVNPSTEDRCFVGSSPIRRTRPCWRRARHSAARWSGPLSGARGEVLSPASAPA